VVIDEKGKQREIYTTVNSGGSFGAILYNRKLDWVRPIL